MGRRQLRLPLLAASAELRARGSERSAVASSIVSYVKSSARSTSSSSNSTPVRAPSRLSLLASSSTATTTPSCLADGSITLVRNLDRGVGVLPTDPHDPGDGCISDAPAVEGTSSSSILCPTFLFRCDTDVSPSPIVSPISPMVVSISSMVPLIALPTVAPSSPTADGFGTTDATWLASASPSALKCRSPTLERSPKVEGSPFVERSSPTGDAVEVDARESPDDARESRSIALAYSKDESASARLIFLRCSRTCQMDLYCDAFAYFWYAESAAVGSVSVGVSSTGTHSCESTSMPMPRENRSSSIELRTATSRLSRTHMPSGVRGSLKLFRSAAIAASENSCVWPVDASCGSDCGFSRPATLKQLPRLPPPPPPPASLPPPPLAPPPPPPPVGASTSILSTPSSSSGGLITLSLGRRDAGMHSMWHAP
mmetsp:Transcript_7908/g.23376  ORF Transcript_7908/g.23376 Transcript_7908/m.23376 type:complete len:428 (+) Transcript_7908:181-1464(+)